MKPLSKGDTCRVRLHTGEVVEAVYKRLSQFSEKCHVLNDGRLVAIGGSTLKIRKKYKITLAHECIFIGPPCVLVPAGVSV